MDEGTLGTLAALGIGAVVGALIGALTTAFFALRREREAARREWLQQALASFYSPVATRLELRFLWNTEMARRRRERPSTAPTLHFDSLEATLDRRVFKASVDVREELTPIIETTLHFVEDAALRKAALAYLRDAYLSEWTTELSGMKERAEQLHFVPVFPETQERGEFHRAVVGEFDRLTTEFHSLSK